MGGHHRPSKTTHGLTAGYPLHLQPRSCRTARCTVVWDRRRRRGHGVKRALCRCHSRYSEALAVGEPGLSLLLRSVTCVFSHSIRHLSQSPQNCPSRLSCKCSNAWGMSHSPYPLRHRAFLTPSLPPLCSPRVILVEDLGTLVGLTSVKDVLHLEPHEQLNSPIVAWSNRGALDGALEELWTWLANVRSSINAWYGRASSRWR